MIWLMQEFSESTMIEKDQKLAWDRNRKKINGLLNRLSNNNGRYVLAEILKINVTRTRGVLVDRILKQQRELESYSEVYSSLISAINCEVPAVGELLVTRLVVLFRRFYKANDRIGLTRVLVFISKLMNYQVLSEILVFQILVLLLNEKTMTNDSVELAVLLLKHTGRYLTVNNVKVMNKMFEQLRVILIDFKELNKKNQFSIEELFKLQATEFSEYPIISDESLNLVNTEDAVVHLIELDSKGLKYEKHLDEYEYDENYEENDKEYYDSIAPEQQELAPQEEEVVELEVVEVEKQPEVEKITDFTETNLVNFQKTVYLTIMSSMSSDEAVHKLLKLDIPGVSHRNRNENTQFQEKLIEIIIKSSSLEKSFSKFHSLIGSKLCTISSSWHQSFVKQFDVSYQTCHLLKSNQLRNVGKFWGFQLASDGLSYEILLPIKLTQATTNSAQRVMVKIIFETLVENLGTTKLKELLDDQVIQSQVVGIFPNDYYQGNDFIEDLRFSINFFTAIGLGVLTDNMRQELEQAQQEEAVQQLKEQADEQAVEPEPKVENKRPLQNQESNKRVKYQSKPSSYY